MDTLDLQRIHDIADNTVANTRRNGKTFVDFARILGYFDADEIRVYAACESQQRAVNLNLEMMRFVDKFGSYFGYAVETAGFDFLVIKRMPGRFIADKCGETTLNDSVSFRIKFMSPTVIDAGLDGVKIDIS